MMPSWWCFVREHPPLIDFDSAEPVCDAPDVTRSAAEPVGQLAGAEQPWL
jgi:hypothetical protein